MQFIVCNVDTVPCPPDQVGQLSFSDAVDFAALGVTVENILYVMSFGMGFVMLMWFFGFCIGAALSMIRKG